MINLIRRLKAGYKKHLSDATEYLANNGANNIEDYRFQAGQIAALRAIIDDLTEVEKSAGADEDAADNDASMQEVI